MKQMTIRCLTASVALCGASHAQTPPERDFDWAVIGDPGNPAYDGGLHGQTAGRGSVDYTFRMSRLEVTTGQWMEYVNTFSQVPGGLSFSLPTFWGATFDRTYSGPGMRWTYKEVPHAPMLPVQGISWQEAARYTNWLHNGKSSDPASLETGAYDTSTWGEHPVTGHRTDGGRLPGAKYWIPSLDEWLKAAHYDPDKEGPGQGGWWLFPHGSDELIEPGPPGIGETSAGWEPVPSELVWFEPLGAYEDTQSPWGLWDVSGGAKEWLEEWGVLSQPTQRALDGAPAGTEGWFFMDRADVIADGSWPHSPIGGLRIASPVVDPGERTPAVTFDLPSVWAVGAIDLTIGWEFRVNEPLDLAAIGVFDRIAPSPEPGLGVGRELALWADGVEVRRTSIHAGAGARLLGRFRYADVEPAPLTPGVSYNVAAYRPSEPFDHIPNVGRDPDIHLDFDPRITFLRTRAEAYVFRFPTSGIEGVEGPAAVNFLVVSPRECDADCDRSGDLTFFDFLCFQNLFAAMDPAADCDGDTEFTFFDFLCFQNAFAAGCE